MPRHTASLLLLMLIPILILTVTACGGGDDDPAEPTPDADVTPVEDTSTSPEVETPAPRWEVDEVMELAGFVDPMIGTKGSGNVIPGAVLPHGMIRLSPDTNEDQGSIDAYDWSGPRMEGITHTHLEGPGGSLNGYSQVLLMPTTELAPIARSEWATGYSHTDEVAEPGYYAVSLDTGIRVELTADHHAGIHRYRFPPGAPQRVILDLDHSNGASVDGFIEQIDDRTIAGWGYWSVHPLLELILGPENPTGFVKVWFRVVFDRNIDALLFFQGGSPFEGATTASGAQLGAAATFQGAAELEARIAISFVSAEQAVLNLDAEVTDRDFDTVRAAARTRWNQRLSRVIVEGTEDVKRRIYTALYHAMLQPADHTEVGGAFASAAGGEHEVFQSGSRRYYTDDWCMWDTYRTSHPLQTILEPETRGDYVWSLLHIYGQGGWLPKCTWTATGYSRVMIGNHAVPIIADAYVKGLRDFDSELAWEAVNKAGTQDTSLDGDDGLCGYLNLGTTPSYQTLGFVPSECDVTQSVSMTLEYAYDDWATARFAEALGRADDQATYDARANSWQAHFNPENGFMQARMEDGSWKVPFDPADTADANDFAEASSWIYTWFVPHDPAGLFAAMGGAEQALERLDAFFAEGHYDVSNQPSFHVPWLYSLAGDPARTQARVREILDAHFTTAPDGLPGNDDAGSMSAWFVFGALGLYPLAPGSTRYELTAPLVDKATLLLNPAHYAGGAFTIEVERADPDDRYVQSATLNGAPLERAWITHEEIALGGTLRFVVGPEPSAWGTALGATGGQ